MLTPALPHLRPSCFPAWHCPLPILYFFTSINIFITWVSSSKSYGVSWVLSDLGVWTPPALPCGGLPTAQPCQASQLSPSSQPHLGMRSATGPEKLLVSSPCTAHGKRCPATRGADRARAGVGACCSGGATVDSLAPEGCVACEPAVSGVSPQRV